MRQFQFLPLPVARGRTTPATWGLKSCRSDPRKQSKFDHLSELPHGSQRSCSRSAGFKPLEQPRGEHLIGREAELQSLVERVCSSQGERISILGRAGSGKTWLVMALLREERVKNYFGNDVYVINCTQLATPEALQEELLRTFQVLPFNFTPDDDVKQQLRSKLRRRGPPRLIVLDDFSQLWDSTNKRLEVEDLLLDVATASDSVLILTSRGTRPPSVRVKWSKPWLKLQGLAIQDARSLYLSYDRQAETDSSLDAVTDELGGIPLAIRLVASCGKRGETPSMLLRRWKARLQDSFVGVPADERDNVALALDLVLQSGSFQHAPAASAMLGILAQLPGGGHYELLPDICTSVHDPAPAFKVLQDHSLIDPGDTPGHFKLLTPIRSYALKHFPPSVSDMITVFKAYFKFIDRVIKNAETPHRDAFMMLYAEETNIRSVLTRALDEYPGREVMSSLALVAPPLTLSHPKTDFLEKAIQVCNTAFKSHWWSGYLQFVLAHVLFVQGLRSKAVSVLRGAIDTVRDQPNEVIEGQIPPEGNNQHHAMKCYETLSTLLEQMDEFEEALAAVKEAMSLALLVGKPYNVADSHRRLASIYRAIGRYEASLASDDEAIAITQELHDDYTVAQCQDSKADTYLAVGRLKESLAARGQALLVHKKYGDSVRAIQSLNQIAVLRNTLGERKAAVEAMDEVISLCRRDGHKKELLLELQSLGDMYTSMAQEPDALLRYQEALALACSMGDHESAASCSLKITARHLSIGHLEDTIESASESVRLYTQTKNYGGVAKAHAAAAEALYKLHHLDDAERSARDAVRAFERSSDGTLELAEAKATELLGTILLDLKRYAEAAASLEKATKLYGSCEDRAGKARVAKPLKLAKAAELKAMHQQALSLPNLDPVKKQMHEFMVKKEDPNEPTAFMVVMGPEGPKLVPLNLNNPMTTPNADAGPIYPTENVSSGGRPAPCMDDIPDYFRAPLKLVHITVRIPHRNISVMTWLTLPEYRIRARCTQRIIVRCGV